MVVWFTDENITGEAFAARILTTHHGMSAPAFFRTEQGKPLTQGIFFSLTHSRGRTFFAACREEVGLDAEWRARPLPAAYCRRLTKRERREDFFRLWTAKEAYVKFCGGTLARMLPALRFEGGALSDGGAPLPVHLAFAEADGYTVALCTASPQDIELRHG